MSLLSVTGEAAGSGRWALLRLVSAVTVDLVIVDCSAEFSAKGKLYSHLGDGTDLRQMLS